MKLWEEGTTREERIALREAEDRMRAELWEDHKLIPIFQDGTFYDDTGRKPINPYWRDSEFTRWNDAVRQHRKELEMATRGRKPAKNSQADKLLTALAFVKVATKDTKQGEYQTHVHIGGNRVVAFDGVIAACHPIEEDFVAYPNLEQFVAALQSCGKKLSLTVDGNLLSVKGEHMTAEMQCLPPEVMHVVVPDPNAYVIDDGIKAALEVCMKYTREGATLIHETAVLLCANSAYGTDGKAIVEYWHGTNLPDMILPRAFCAAVVKAKAKLVGFGYGNGSSVTFYFDDMSWLKTQLYAEGYPMQAKTVLNVPANPLPLPADFVTAVTSVAAFSEDGSFVVENGQVVAFFNDTETGAQYDVKDLSTTRRLRFNSQSVLKVAEHMKLADFNTDPDKLLWFGDSVRGAIMRITEANT